MKRIVDWVFAITAISAVAIVGEMCFELQLQNKHLKLMEEVGPQDRQYVTAALPTETEAVLEQTNEATVCTQELADKLPAAERLAGLLECEVDRLKPLRQVMEIIVHHSESVFGDVPTIDAWHRERGWDGVGYHYVITNGGSRSGQPCRDGEIQTGRDERVVGAHARGRNQNSIGICLIGTDAFTPAQRRSLRVLLVELCRRYGITPSAATIQRHHEQCPGPSLDLGTIIAEVEGHLAHN